MKDIRILLGIGFIYCFCNISAVMYGKGASVSFTLDELKCENMINPLGIDNTTPHFSWKLQGNRLNLCITIPAGTTATVYMPDSTVSCRKDGKKVNVKNKTFMVKAGKSDIVFDLDKQEY